MSYNTSRDYLMLALAQADETAALEALRLARKEEGCDRLIAELEQASAREYEELSRRDDNADGTDASQPRMPAEYDTSKGGSANPEDILRGNSLDQYPSTKVTFLMDGQVGENSSVDKTVADIQDDYMTLHSDPNDVALHDLTGDDNALKVNSDAADTFNYSLDSENNGFDVNDFQAASDLPDVSEVKSSGEYAPDHIDQENDEDNVTSTTHDYDEDISEPEDDILNADDNDSTVFDDDLEDFDMDDLDTETAVSLMDAPQYPVVSTEDFPTKIWDRGEQVSDLEDDYQEHADTDTTGDDDSLDIGNDVNAKAVTAGQYWYQHNRINDITYHRTQADLYCEAASEHKRIYNEVKRNGNGEEANIQHHKFKHALRWQALHANKASALLREAATQRAQNNLATL